MPNSKKLENRNGLDLSENETDRWESEREKGNWPGEMWLENESDLEREREREREKYSREGFVNIGEMGKKRERN